MPSPADEWNLPSRTFQPRVYGLGAWTDNLPFACDVVATLRPQLLVELGTDRGESYFGFCQAVAENGTGTRCFAIDTWRGDEQTGGYDETTFTEVSLHNREHYAAFSTLLRCRFDEALDRFGAESIDLLHIDGLHTEEAVRHDVEAWLPKVRPGGIVLLHDIRVRTGNFGVWKVWDELNQRGRAYVFPDGPGLGVWEKPPTMHLPAPVEPLLNSPNDTAANLGDYYRARARELQEKIAREWRDLTIRHTAAAHQTVIQVFHTHDGSHREEDSAGARIGHEAWKKVTIPLPAGAGAAPLRIDFVSAYTTIDIACVEVAAGSSLLFRASDATAWPAVKVAGDAEVQSHPAYLRLRITGLDPQLYLPPLGVAAAEEALRVTLQLRVSREAPLD